MKQILLREIIDGIEEPHIFIECKSMFVILPNGIGGTFQNGSKMMPNFRRIE